jgi:nicotinate-nucleotide adenylyltransferase
MSEGSAGPPGERSFAIFGGTFDPIHNAHLAVARAALERFGLDHILFIPAAMPPHKTGSTRTAFEHRARMVEIACAGEPQFRVSRIEEGTARSYSFYTVEALQRENPGWEIYFLIGADAFAEIETWHRWQELVAMVKFIVVGRPGASYTIPTGAHLLPLEGLSLPISSSQVRQQLAAGIDTTDVPATVLAYVREHRLYAALD